MVDKINTNAFLSPNWGSFDGLRRFLALPPKEILDFVGYTPQDSMVLHNVISQIPDSPESRATSTILMATLIAVKDFYAGKLENWRDMDCLNTQEIAALACDGIENAWIHGSRGLAPIMHTLVLASGGLLQGFRDAGNYFSREDVKRAFEAKVQIHSSGIEIKAGEFSAGAGEGVKMYVYGYSDRVYVDNPNSTLWCAQLMNRIIARPRK